MSYVLQAQDAARVGGGDLGWTDVGEIVGGAIGSIAGPVGAIVGAIDGGLLAQALSDPTGYGAAVGDALLAME